ncbi:type VII secretion protein EssC [Clostridium uliginosum]|uniref:DNA segregation ATPase FtsK/SpoIIIE, S-DNA-T family n=1 Tax=Clostridium uliginosum TaxID=119641 RepID=A0A1I1PMJ3_9CLOT|nr:type VII secretion protein EssC [Clostridium uliginosum]SFD11099.1 DNA segregation ATPase FtsK/SpoIIIE, S-DNA-T family [Clostridium uliginosum]
MYYKNSILIFEDDAIKEVPCDKKVYITNDFKVGNNNNHMGYIECDEVNKKATVIMRNSEKIELDSYQKKAFKENESILIMYFINTRKRISTKYKNALRIGDFKNSDIYLTKSSNLNVTIEKGKLYFSVESEVYLNGKRCSNNPENLVEGDLIFVGNIKINYYENSLIIEGGREFYKTLLNEIDLNEEKSEDFPKYKRSPRIFKEVPTDKISFKKPPTKSEHKKGQLAKLIVPPIVMLILTIVISFIMPRGIYIIMSIAATSMSTVFGITSYINDKKETSRKNKLREEVYTKYLLDLRKTLNNLRKKQIESLRYHNPNLNEITKMTEFYNSRIYERNNNDDDFLNICIGKSDIEPSYQMSFANDAIEIEKDPLVENAEKVFREFNIIKDMPLSIDLKKAHLGIVGEKKYVHEQLNLIFTQLTFFQSYHDIEIILLSNEDYKEQFKWLSWYPHFKIKSINVTGIIDTERVRDQVLGNISKIIKDRKIKQEEEKKEGVFLPHYIFIIDEPKLVINHSIMEYLQEKESKLGFSIIYTTNLKANLPENIKSIFTIDNYQEGTLILNEGILVNKKIKLNHVDIDISFLSRRLACLEHIKGMSNKIPDSITFFDMYKVSQAKELNVKQRWDKNLAYKTLAVPLGVRGKDDYVYLNLHEKAHGPHGLIAGTTGSGKSEIIQSYILSLAVNFHPYEVGFLLIDYKGGGMAGLFKNLPHLLGTITNLDGSGSMRAMASIKSELSRRQQIFSRYGVNHINQYNKLFRNGESDEPMPHLFLISDEFAELKKEQPDFMSELVSAARIGRSLGIHLILATQKPSGVVDDQIWSNSRFKLALKVQNQSDSNEVIKTPDAANITQPGRAYLQVGNNEIYELFQSAWSGATYENDDDNKEFIDNRVYIINSLGQSELLNEDLSEVTDESKVSETELDVTINYMQDLFKQLNLKNVKKPWLPPLEEKIVSPHIIFEEIQDVSNIEKLSLSAEIGIVDIPENQLQAEYIIDFSKDGNCAIFASTGFGKTITLTTIIFTLAFKNSPKNLQLFILDFGNSALIPMKDLPHTRDYIKFDDSEKFFKLIHLIEKEIKNRKLLLGEKSVANFSMYNEVSEEKLPALFIIIDNYDVIKEFGLEAEDFIQKVTRDGAGLGIYTIVTASRQGAIKYSIFNNFKNKIAHYLFDETEINSLIGRSIYKLYDIPGKAMVKLENPNIMQVYSSVDFEDDIDYTNGVIDMIERFNELYTGDKLEGIRMLPEVLKISHLKELTNDKDMEKKIPIGLDAENVTSQFIELNGGVRLIIGPQQSGKTNLIKLIIELKGNIETYVFDSEFGDLYQSKEYVNQYITESEEAKIFLNNMIEITNKRRSDFEEYRSKETGIAQKIYFNSLSPVMVLIEDLDNFIEILKNTRVSSVEKILEDSMNVGVTFIGTTQSSKFKGYDEVTKMFKNTINAVILDTPNEQTILNVPRVKKQKLPIDFAYMLNKGEVELIKIPKSYN